jgi:hypothetical protein
MTHETANRQALVESPEVMEEVLREDLTERAFDTNDLSLLVRNLLNAPVTGWAAY